jgi:beta-lactamase superfamily II metal-dependent hydrolase
MADPSIKIKALLAGNGDCVLISYDTEEYGTVNILVDGGNGKSVYRDHLKKIVEKIVENEQLINLVIITHIDQDHIKGIIYLTRDIADSQSLIRPETVEEYWFNSALSEKIYRKAPNVFDISAKEMHELEQFLHNQPDHRWNIKEKIGFPLVKDFFGATITILSPNEEIVNLFTEEYADLDIGVTADDYDYSLKTLYDSEKKRLDEDNEDLDNKLENATSIAFLFEYKGKSLLHMGDAIPSVINDSLKAVLRERNLVRLKVDAVKLSHHASRKSVSFKFLELVSTTKYIVCANGLKARLPNKSTFAKILLHPNRDFNDHVEFYFNYPDFSKRLKFTEEEKDTCNFSCNDANFEHGYCLLL